MAATAVISIMCRDRMGLVANVTEAITAMGGDISDMSASVLGKGIVYVALSIWPVEPPISVIQTRINQLPGLSAADVKVNTFELLPFTMDSMEKGTHRIQCWRNNDNYGDLGDLCSTFAEFKANLIRVHAKRYLTGKGWEGTVTLEANIPEQVTDSCLKALGNKAAALGYSCDWDAKTDTG